MASSKKSESILVPVIVVNWNGIDDTLECVRSVLESTYTDFKIFLVDNGSTNGEGRRLLQIFREEEHVNVICLEENLGFTKANCQIVEEFLNDEIKYFVLLNNDVVVESNWLSSLIQAADAEKAQVVSSKLILHNERSLMDNAGHQILNTGEILPIGHRRSTEDFNSSFENVGACAAACLYSMQMIREIGFFDEYFTTGYEDAEFGLRAFVSGFKCIYAPRAIAYHKGGQSINKIFDVSYARMIQGKIWYTYFKLMPWPAILVGLPFILQKFLVLLLLNLLFLRFKHLKIMFGACSDVARDLRIIGRARRAFFKEIKPRTSWDILRNQTFFLPYDFHRFVRIYLKKKPSALDHYGSD